MARQVGLAEDDRHREARGEHRPEAGERHERQRDDRVAGQPPGFTLGTNTYTLDDNNNGASLHGGFEGFNRKVWNAEAIDTGNKVGVKLTPHYAVEVDAYHSLAVRDLQRGHSLGLPSGEAVAARMGERPLTPDEVGLGDAWHAGTPHWFYILREADVRSAGERLGPVGGRIVGEVLIAILDNDPGSFRTLEPDWQPTLPASTADQFGIADVIRFVA